MDHLTTVLKQFEQSDLDLRSNLKQSIVKLILLSSKIPHPAQGHTLERWQVLSQVSAANLNLAKWFESHLDALSILDELGCSSANTGLWAVWAAEGSKDPIRFDQGTISGLKHWCSGAGLVQHGLITYKNQQQQSQLITVDMNRSGLRLDHSAWHAVGMQHTQTASIQFNQVNAEQVGTPNQYLTRVGFWHGAAGIAACWFGATTAIADFLFQACKKQPNDFKLMYLGEIITALAVTKNYFHQLAQQIDSQPHLSHELEVRVLREQAEKTAQLVLEHVGQALGARPFCEDQKFAQLTADLPVFLRQSHAAFDLKNIGELAVSHESSLWTL